MQISTEFTLPEAMRISKAAGVSFMRVAGCLGFGGSFNYQAEWEYKFSADDIMAMWELSGTEDEPRYHEWIEAQTREVE